MKYLVYLFLFLISSYSYSVGFYYSDPLFPSLEMEGSGIMFIGARPIYANTNYKWNSLISNWSSFGLAVDIGYDKYFTEYFGLRGQVLFSALEGQNKRNSFQRIEESSMLDYGVIGSVLVGRFSLGGGYLRRLLDIEASYLQNNIKEKNSGFLKIIKLSFDQPALNKKFGFSVGGSYIFGQIGRYDLKEYRIFLSFNFLMHLK